MLRCSGSSQSIRRVKPTIRMLFLSDMMVGSVRYPGLEVKVRKALLRR